MLVEVSGNFFLSFFLLVSLLVPHNVPQFSVSWEGERDDKSLAASCVAREEAALWM
jgi:hypothetical protein